MKVKIVFLKCKSKNLKFRIMEVINEKITSVVKKNFVF